jgi:cobaltochelatase CobN
MHLLSSRPGGFVEDDSIITRLDQTPADMVVLSSADTTLSLLADAYRMWQAEPRADGPPTLRLANLLHLRQSASLDLYIDEVLQHARLVIVDHLGAESTWPYGIEQLQKLARRKGQKLAMFSGDNQEDPELLAKGTLEPEQSRALWQYLRAGGLGNAREFLRMAAAWGLNQGREERPCGCCPRGRACASSWLADDAGHLPGLDDLQARWTPGAPVAMLVFYRSHLLAANTEAFDAMADALLARGLNPLPLALESLKDGLCLQTLRSLCITHQVQIILNTTAFAALGEHARTGEADALAGDIRAAGDCQRQQPRGLAGRQPGPAPARHCHAGGAARDGRPHHDARHELQGPGPSLRADADRCDQLPGRARPRRLDCRAGLALVPAAQQACGAEESRADTGQLPGQRGTHGQRRGPRYAGIRHRPAGSAGT